MFVYALLSAFRVLSSIFIQNGYIHPDEFFETTEIITGDLFGVVHDRPWKFNKDTPVKSISLLYIVFGIPLYIAKGIFTYYNISWTPDLLLIIFRLVTCAISFITDYSLYKICKILKLKPNRFLLLLSSSYVVFVFGTMTFTSTIELALVSILLWKVIDCIIFSEKIIAAENEIRVSFKYCTLLTDKITMSRKLRKLPSHHFRHCLEIGTLLATGTFNRPTFLMYAVIPISYWIFRGFSKNYSYYFNIFYIRVLILIVCILPGVFLFILIDSIYFEHINSRELYFVMTPLNLLHYALSHPNLNEAEHGIIFRVVHSIIHILILFNVMVLLFLKRVQLNNLIKIVINYRNHYYLSPSINEVSNMMVANVLIPMTLLTVFRYQEPRFLLPLLLPLIFTTSRYFSNRYTKDNQLILPIWCLYNIIGLIFYGYIHQAGITPMISHLFKDIKYISNVHLIHSHTYSVPVGLLMVPQFDESKSYMHHQRIEVHNLGLSMKPDEMYETVKNINETIKYKNMHAIYFALSGPLTQQFESVSKMSNLTFTKKTFFPHWSMESFDNNNFPYIANLKELLEMFSLVLYKITTTTE